MSDTTNTETATTQADEKVAAVYNPPVSTGTPEWVRKMKEDGNEESWDVRIIKQAIDLFSYGDGAFWCEGQEGMGYKINPDGSVWDETYSTNVATTPFMPFREAWVDALPNGQYQLVTEKVCAIGSIQLLIGGGEDNADYNTIIQRLNNIASDQTDGEGSIVGVNDGYGREEVLNAMQEYVRRHGGKPGYVLPDYKPFMRLEKREVEPIESDEDDD